jgi:hypothetical protein
MKVHELVSKLQALEQDTTVFVALQIELRPSADAPEGAGPETDNLRPLPIDFVDVGPLLPDGRYAVAVYATDLYIDTDGNEQEASEYLRDNPGRRGLTDLEWFQTGPLGPTSATPTTPADRAVSSAIEAMHDARVAQKR